MKTIEERAREYATHIYGGSRKEINIKEEDAYIAGATEQKEIDIERVCEWLRENVRPYTDLVDNYHLEKLKKFIENEKLDRKRNIE